MTEQILAYAKKQGWNVGLVLAILWQNNRLNDVEARLYDCLQDRAEIRNISTHKDPFEIHVKLVAVLPCDNKRRNVKKIS